jgi:hypothetical protein
MIFKLNKDGGGFNQVYSFAMDADGYEPSAALVAANDGALYGTARLGATLGLGTVFRLWLAATPDMLSVAIVNGAAQVRFAGETDRQYQILRSTNLIQWDLLDTVTMPSSGTILYPDSNPPASAAYYRAAWVR